jgi:hypothetical protein
MAIAPSFGSSDLAGMETICCADGCSDEGEEGNDHESTDCGVCNPLFSCACYCGFIINSHSFKLGTVKSVECQNSIYCLSAPLQLSYSIWQPPKLAA